MTASPFRWDRSPAVDEAVERLLAQYTLEQKIDLVSGKVVFDTSPMNRLPADSPIPPFSLSDGGAGIRIPARDIRQPNTTALPAPMALAATWNEQLAQQYGDLIGAEARANGHSVVLGPAVDIARAPLAGRNFESYGEDPLLQARMAVAVIQAMQQHAVQAVIKHYVVNNQEYLRNTIDVHVDERTLHEIYLPPYEAAIREAGVAAVMGSYNRMQGTYACEHAFLLTEILRNQFGFRGYVISDFMATHSTARAALAGLDWELTMHGHWGMQLLEAVQTGQLPAEQLDEMVRRILRPTVGLGLLEQPRAPHPIPVEQHRAVAQAVAEQAIVLLKNEQELLPLDPATIRSIAVIGPDADTIAAAGGGSAMVPPSHTVSVVEGLRARFGPAVRVAHAAGVDPIGPGVLLPGLHALPSGVLTPLAGQPGEHGLRVAYWDNLSRSGEPVLVRTEGQPELNRGFFDLEPILSAASPRLPRFPGQLPGRMAVRWSGQLHAPQTGTYQFSLTSLGSACVLLDGQRILENRPTHPVSPGTPPAPFGSEIGNAASAIQVTTGSIDLQAGQLYDLVIEYAADAREQSFFNEAMLRLGWQPPEPVVTALLAEAVELAQQSDIAVVVVRTYETEAMDRADLELPNGQAELIRAVAAANPRTIVVAMSGAPFACASWDTSVPALLAAWYPGQEQGHAIARILCGDVNPSGKLPVTFPHSISATPLRTPEQYPGVHGTVAYTEGLFVGYRGYDQEGITPHYPFGHGLAYTHFAYHELRITPGQSDGTHPITIQFVIENTGTRAGTEIAQLYLGLPATTGEPLLRLAGWARIRLEAGERRTATIILDPQSTARPCSFWNTSTRTWELATGTLRVVVGASSRDLRLEGTIALADQT